MKFRHELKHEVNFADVMILRTRLAAVMQRDKHAIDNKYVIRSLYFDTPEDKALNEKRNGVAVRDKFRVRFYNEDTSFITLEKKSKVKDLCSKQSCQITKEEAQLLIDGDLGWMLEGEERPLCKELYTLMKTTGLRPKTIVEYTRDPFVFKAGNVRVTIDYNIRTGDFRTDFLNPDTITLPVCDNRYILEVKWDEFLPDIIRDAVTLPGRRTSSFSKYEQCRIYG